jgi:hypothetical protein
MTGILVYPLGPTIMVTTEKRGDEKYSSVWEVFTGPISLPDFIERRATGDMRLEDGKIWRRCVNETIDQG